MKYTIEPKTKIPSTLVRTKASVGCDLMIGALCVLLGVAAAVMVLVIGGGQ